VTAVPTGKLTVNAKLLRDLIRARVSLVRLEARVIRRDFLPLIQALQADVFDAISRAQAGAAGSEITLAQMERVLSDADKLLTNAAASLPAAAEASAATVAAQQARMIHATVKRAAPNAIGKVFSGLDVAQVAQVAQADASALTGPWFQGWAGRAGETLKQSLGISVGQGEDIAKATRRAAAALGKSRREMASIVRTAMQTAANKAHQAYQDENEDVFKGVQWVATLDTRTCPVCGPLDGKIWTYEDDPEAEGLVSDMPPLPRHPNCRCVSVPVTKSWRDLGVDIDDVPDDATRASMDGDVPGTMDWETWLKTQPPNIQASILGPTKFKQWNAGGILESASVTLRRIAGREAVSPSTGRHFNRAGLISAV